MAKSNNEPHEPWSHRLKNGAKAGDPTKAPRCGAKNRAGRPCKCPAMKNGRCRLHGGHSTGPKTIEGKRRSRAARLTHGEYSARNKAALQLMRAIVDEAGGIDALSELMAEMYEKPEPI